MARLILSFLLFVLPFVVFPLGSSFFETPKVFAAEIAIELLMAFYLFKSHFSYKTFDRRLLILCGVIFGLTILDLLFFRTDLSLFGNQFRLQGIFLLWHLLLLALISSQIKFQPLPFLPSLSLIVLLGATFYFGHNASGRAIATLGEPNALAATAIFLWPFWVFGLTKVPQFLVKTPIIWRLYGLAIILGVIPAAIMITLTGSRSALIALFIQVIFGVIWHQTKKLRIAIMVSLVLITLALVLPFKEAQGLFENRLEIWQTALSSSLESPVWGHGFGNLERVLNATSARLNNNVQYSYVDSAHNLFLDYLVQGGILGLAAISGLIYLTFRNYLQSKRILELTLLIGLITVMLFNPVSVVTLVAFWWLIGRSFNNPTS